MDMLKKVVIFFGLTNSEVVIFWGIKCEHLSDPPPPSPVIKICEWGPWGYPPDFNLSLAEVMNHVIVLWFRH